MDPHTYKGKLWAKCPTTTANNSFFHAVFGTRTGEGGAYFDKQAKFRRMRWAAFLTYFENEQMPPSLAGMLTKCLAANDNCEHVSIEDGEDFGQYVSDVMAGEQSVTKEEIPILATLENVSIAVMLDGKPDPFILVKPSPDILGSYQNVSGKLKEVVLCLEGNTFSRLELLHENSSPKSEKNKVEKKTDSCKYRKGGSAGSIGTDYQVSLLALVILNALRKELAQWKLSTENDDAGKFDDIVLEWSEGTVLIQSKHKEDHKKMITLEELISINTKHDDFSLPKYFLWFQVVKAKFNVKNVIICTNAGVHKKAMKFLDPQENNTESLLHYEDGNCLFYTLNEKVLPDLKEKTILYYHQNFRNKGIEESVITNDNLKEFLKQLELYFNYPSLESLAKIIERLMSLTKGSSHSQNKITPLEMLSKVRDWFQQKEGVYLTDIHAKALFSEIWRDKYCQKLQQYKVSFQKNDLNFQGSKQIFHVTAKYGYLLPVIKIYHTIHDNHSQILYVNPDDDINAQKQVIEAFGLPQYVYLVIVCSKTTEEFATVDIGKLKDILEPYKYKKIVFIAEDSKFAEQIGMSDVVHVDRPVTFEDLSSVTQNRVVMEKNVMFQGKRVSLEELLPGKTKEDYDLVINSDVLEKLVRREDITVGIPPSDLDEHTNRYYISRTFRRTQEEMCDLEGATNVLEELQTTRVYRNQTFDGDIETKQDEIWSESREETFPEGSIFDVKEKLVVIADSAGMGKSTVLIKLALSIKENNPHLWVVRIALNDFTRVLGDWLEKGKRTLTVKELLDSKNETKLTNHLEKCLFSSNQKVVLMLDGIDEVSPDYTGLILSLVKRCYEESNFIKIFLTTRSHMAKELEAVLKVRSFVLQPFTEDNQVEFLTNYWADNLQLEDEASKDKCTRYAKALINNVLWTNLENNKENHFASLPLHVRMTAEIFQENTRLDDSTNWGGCREYVIGDEAEPKFTQTMNVTKLYDMFINKKWNIFYKKENPDRKTWANQELMRQFEKSRVYHRNLALEVTVEEDKLRYFSGYHPKDKYMETSLLKIGIVQKLDDKLDFIHRTFADYFLAEILHMELQQNQTLEFQKFLIDTIFLEPQYNIARIFFDSFIRKIVDSLPSNIFEKYQSVIQESSSELCTLQSKLIHTLAGEGCLTILQLLFKCVDFQIVTDKEISVIGLYETEFDEDVRDNICGNTLNVLKYLTEQAGVNIKDEKSQMPLHRAALKGRTGVVKFLIESGADKYYADDKYGFTALHFATCSGGLDTVTFLMEHDYDVNQKNNLGHTLLHLASAKGHLETVKFVFQLGIGSEIRDNGGQTALHLAGTFGHLETVKFLLECGVDFTSTNNDGRTLLHSACVKGHLETIKFLLQLGISHEIRDNHGITVLHLAACFGQTDIIKHLVVQHHADFNVTNKFGRTLLHSASTKGHLETVKLLLKLGVDTTVREENGYTVLHLAACFGQLDIVKLLVAHGLDINVTNNNGCTLLHSASAKGRLETIKFLLELGIDSRSRDNEGNTALHLAATSGHVETVKFLVGYGLDWNVTNNIGRTLLHSASANGHLETIKFLVEYGLDFNVTDGNNRTMLHLAGVNGHLELVKYLLDVGVDYKLKTKDRNTIMHLAASLGKLDVVKLLVAHDPFHINNTGYSDRTPLHIACANGHLDVTKFLLEFDVDLGIKDNGGYTVLHLAASFGQLEIVKFLIERGLDVNVTNNNSRTLLHSASANGHLETVKFLLAHGLDFTIRDKDGYTTLHLAVSFGQSEIVKFLVEYGLDIKVTNNHGWTVLHSASANGHLETVKFFLEVGIDFQIKNNNGNTALHLAASFGKQETVKYLLEYGLDVNVTGNHGRTLLHLASETGHLDIVKFLIDIGVDFKIKDRDGFTTLHIATCFGQLETAKFLINYGLDFHVTNNVGRTLLHSASANGHSETVKYLLDIGVDSKITDKEGYTALHLAARCGHLDTTKLLVEYGLDVKAIDNNNRTLLHSAGANGHLEVTKFLLENGVDYKVKGKTGNTVLHLAAGFGKMDVVKLLVEYDLDCNDPGYQGRTLLHLACVGGNLDIIEFLLGLGVDSAITDDEGYTALHLAAYCGQVKIVKFLVEYGLDCNVTNNDGRTLLHSASANGHLSTVKLLLEVGTDRNTRDKYGYTVLHLAACFGRVNIVKHLIAYGLDVKVTTKIGRTLLHSASANGHWEMVKFLLGQDVDRKIRDKDGYTVLHLAACFGRLNIVKLLVAFGLDFTVTNNNSRTLLHSASANGHLETVKFLLRLGVDFKIKDREGYTVLHVAACNGHLDTVKFLVQYGVVINVTDNNNCSSLFWAGANGYVEVVKFLLNTGADYKIKNSRGNTILHRAAAQGKLNILALFLEYDLDFNDTNYSGCTPLHLACVRGHLDIIKFLLGYGVDSGMKDDEGSTALHQAASFGHLETVKFLIKYGLDFNVTNKYGHTPLQLAAMNQRTETAKYLLQTSLDCRIKDKAILHVAAGFGQLDIVKRLIEDDWDCNGRCYYGRTPLHAASAGGQLDIVQFLLEHGADFTIRDDEGYTALHLATCSGRLETVKFLVNYGLDFNVTDNNDRTLLHSASASGSLETVKFLLELGVDLKARDKDDNTALNLAAAFGEFETGNFPVDYGIESNTAVSLSTANNDRSDTVKMFKEHLEDTFAKKKSNQKQHPNVCILI